jgi:hypothetical protein
MNAMSSHPFLLAQFGTCLTTRDMAVPIRSNLEQVLACHGLVEIDFSKIEVITPSFADELLGVLIETIGAQKFKTSIRFAGVREDIKRLVNLVLNARLHKARHAA